MLGAHTLRFLKSPQSFQWPMSLAGLVDGCLLEVKRIADRESLAYFPFAAEAAPQDSDFTGSSRP